MAQYKVPQDVEAEDKLIGPFSFRQFIYLGVAVLTGSWLALLALPAVFAVMNRFVIAREERYLTARFGTAYTSYAARVRRWL